MADISRSFMNIRGIADATGVAGAVLCALHCLLSPVLLVAGAAGATLLIPDESFHSSMLVLVVPASVVAFLLGCRYHKDIFTLSLGAISLFAFILAATVLHDIIGESGEKLVTLISASTLTIAHLRNFRLCRISRCEHNRAWLEQ